jgi:hypothetical protein
MAIQHSILVRNARLDAITAQNGNSGKLRIYQGTIPTDCSQAPNGTLLVELTMNSTFAPAASAGVLTLNAITSANAVSSGTAQYYRLYKSDGTTCTEQGTVGTSGADLNLVSTTITSGQPVSVTSWTKTEANA